MASNPNQEDMKSYLKNMMDSLSAETADSTEDSNNSGSTEMAMDTDDSTPPALELPAQQTQQNAGALELPANTEQFNALAGPMPQASNANSMTSMTSMTSLSLPMIPLMRTPSYLPIPLTFTPSNLPSLMIAPSHLPLMHTPSVNSLGSFPQTSPAVTINTQGPLNTFKAQWGNSEHCSFSNILTQLSGKTPRPCSTSKNATSTCSSCETIKPFHMKIEFTRVVPASDVKLLKNSVYISFPLPNGERLAVFKNEQDAIASPWTKIPDDLNYVLKNSAGIKAICLTNCTHCSQMEIRPNNHPEQFCSRNWFMGNGIEKKSRQELGNLMSIKQEHNPKRKRDETVSAREHGRPTPSRFVFGQSRFPFQIELPPNVLLRNVKGEQGEPQLAYLPKEEVVVYFDDVMMPFNIIDDTIHISVPKNPFAKLYRPKEYDNLAITVCVYMKGGNRKFKAEFLTTETQQTEINKLKQEMAPKDSSAQPLGLNLTNSNLTVETLDCEQIYKSTLRFYMRCPSHGEGASDSESDTDETTAPKGVVAKRRYHMADHLQLNMCFKGQEAFYTVIQTYLRGGFFKGSEQDKRLEKSRRNGAFTEAMKPNLDPNISSIEAPRKYVGDLLMIVGTYYMQHHRQEPDFREGIMQLLDFSHSLGSQGVQSFVNLLRSGIFNLTPGTSRQFEFERKFGTEIKIVTLTVSLSKDEKPKLSFNEEIGRVVHSLQMRNAALNLSEGGLPVGRLPSLAPNYETEIFQLFHKLAISEDTDENSQNEDGGETKIKKEVIKTEAQEPVPMQTQGSSSNGTQAQSSTPVVTTDENAQGEGDSNRRAKKRLKRKK